MPNVNELYVSVNVPCG